MFYIIEILNRFKYFCFSYFTLFFVVYLNYNTFFSSLNYLFKELFDQQNNKLLNYYIYTHPFELYYTQLYFCFIVSLYIIIPYLLWQLLDYSKTSLYSFEYNVLRKQLIQNSWFFILIYLCLYKYIIPFFLDILQTVKQTYFSSFYTVFFELKVQDFINFILYLNTIFMVCILFLLILIFFILKIALVKILLNKKILYLAALIFSTFISPPDILSQLILFLIIIFTIEFVIFIRLIFHYFKNKCLW